MALNIPRNIFTVHHTAQYMHFALLNKASAVEECDATKAL